MTNISTGLSQYDWSESLQSIKRLGTEAWGEEVGVFGIDSKERFIYLSEQDNLWMAQQKDTLKDGEYYVRMITYNSSLSRQAFLIKINPSRGVVYFPLFDEDDCFQKWERQTKVKYLRTSLF